ncbi:MAG: dihydroneopterin aldolase [Alphaproteobacteria bacterium]|nr:MAG: dihydroneopterin aldolase [Alphaproteobacteria bacterium]
MTKPFSPLTMPVAAIHAPDAMRRLRHVFVRDLLLDGRVGVYDREREQAQRLRINLDLAVAEGPDAHGDRLDNVLCYERLVEQVAAIVRGGHVNLVETLAERIADAMLAHACVHSVRVRVEKLDAIADAASVGVGIERQRPLPL